MRNFLLSTLCGVLGTALLYVIGYTLVHWVVADRVAFVLVLVTILGGMAHSLFFYEPSDGD